LLVAGAATVLVLTPVVEGLGAAANGPRAPERAVTIADRAIAADVAAFVAGASPEPR
jgi:hypothetical protein